MTHLDAPRGDPPVPRAARSAFVINYSWAHAGLGTPGASRSTSSPHACSPASSSTQDELRAYFSIT
ncbi:hypothetical protein FB451DRAFT_1406730 [Mycena latifolia]|nr:hypothetical protein FB451DRAFT_1406730 [Mycena latifolia]